MATDVSKSVQQYLDETPLWSDGTPIGHVELTPMQWRIWWLAAAGKFFEGMIVFMTGVALPLIALEFNLGAVEKGMVGAASLFGILVGATTLGGLADRVGRKQMFIIDGLSLPHPAERHRHNHRSRHPGWRLPAGRLAHLALRHRDHRRQSRNTRSRRLGSGLRTGLHAHPLPASPLLHPVQIRLGPLPGAWLGMVVYYCV